jgi:hypothetical protein
MKGSTEIWRLAARLAVIGSITVASACASAQVADQEAFRCTAANGHSDAQALIIPSNSSTVSGKILLHSADTGPEWNSLIKILVHQHGAHYSDGDCGCDGIAIHAFKNPDRVEIYATTNGHETPIILGAYNTPIDFKMSMTAQGMLTVSIGSNNPKIQKITLQHPEHNSVEMSCSGADVSFLSLQTV